MEKIKQALQLATLEPGVDGKALAGGLGPRSPRPPGSRAESLDFAYTESRQFEFSQRLLDDGRLVTGRGRDPVTRAYKLLRTQVFQQLAKHHWSTIAVVSPGAGEGKTLTAINLGVSLASSPSHTALLVDLDWLHPSVHTHFEYEPEHDVCSFLRGEQPLSAALVNPGLPRFCFLPCGAPVDDSSEQLGELGGFVRELKGRYRNRIVLFDLPPLFATDDALSFLPLVDCALLVVEENRTKRDDIVRSLELLGSERLLGTVMNKSRQAPGEY